MLDLVTSALITLLLTIILCWYFYYKRCFQYWRKRNVVTRSPIFPMGNLAPSMLGAENLFILLQNIYNDFKNQGLKHGGLYFFNGPIYFPIDPEIIKNIMSTDFEYFVDRGMYYNEDKVPLTAHLFNMSGTKWRNLRTKLSPTFTSGKLKTMYSEIFVKNTEVFINYLDKITMEQKEVNSKILLQNFTTDIISSSAFGLECNALTDPNSEMAKIVQKLLAIPIWGMVKTVFVEGLQNPGVLIKPIHDNIEFLNFFSKVVSDTIKYRETNHLKRNDFLSLLMEIRDKEGLSHTEMIAQSFLFFIAGLETSSTTMSYCLHEMAHNQDVQNKLREDLYKQLGNDYRKYTYDDIMKLPYLDQVVKETLRMYPVVGTLNRMCVKDYKVPKTDLTLEKGTPVIISTLGLQRDPEYFPNPLEFKPERFDPEKNVVVPFTYMPFGEGPRICIGMRYGYLQTKLGIAAILSQFQILPSEKTPRFIEFDKIVTSFLLSRKEGFFVKFKKI